MPALRKIKNSDYDLEILKIITLLKEYEDKYEKSIPVIIAGGINSKVDMEHAF